MPRRGKRIAVLSLVTSAVVATIGGWLARPRLVEEWYLLRLDADDYAVRLDAANRLAERRSLRAIPHLMDVIEKESRERALVISKSTIGDDPWIRFTPIVHALYRIGPAGMKRLEEAVLRAQPLHGSTVDPLVHYVRSLHEPPKDREMGFFSVSSPGVSSYTACPLEETWLIGAAVLLCWASPELRVEEEAYGASPR